jgi:hypothetical protein
MPPVKELLSAAERLHAYVVEHHYGQGLVHGPDAGVRFNLRLWRFFKSAFHFIRWGDDYVFMQTQGYWILANWMLHEKTGEPCYRQWALESTEATLRLQQPEGYWAYPLPERKHLIATVEGDWAAIGLLASYEREANAEYLAGAVRWYDFLVSRVGFQEHSPGKAINYFDQPRGKIPNNSVEAVWMFLRLWKTTGDERYLEHVDGLLEFLSAVQLSSGELPYIVESRHERGRDHYLCYQYNAFQFLKLGWANSIRPEARTKTVMARLAGFLEKGVTAEGVSAADCSHTKPEVDYYTAVLGAALHDAAKMGVAQAAELSERCYARTMARQRTDGAFAYSTGDYGLLRDARSYPRPLVMTLFHLLYPSCGNGFASPVDG